MTTTEGVRRRHWALFADWCAAVDRTALPATAETVMAFLAELPTGPATTRRRLGAIDAAHHANRYPPPSANPHFDALARPGCPPRFDPDLVAAALANIPIGGWPTGIVGRRDAAVVALICTAGATRRQVQALRTDSGAYRRGGQHPPGETGAGSAAVGTEAVGECSLASIAATPHPGPCPACAVTRWQRVALAITAAGWRSARNELADLGETLAGTETAHDCIRPIAPVGNEDHRPLFWAIDRHGSPQTAYPLSVRSITTIVATRLAATARPDDKPSTLHGRDGADGGPVSKWDGADHARALAQRKAATDRLASYEELLENADAYAEAVLQRLDTELSEMTHDAEPGDKPTRQPGRR